MKKLLVFLLLATSVVSAPAAPAVSTISRNFNFSVYRDARLQDTNLDAYRGKILIIMLMTPWCPICQSHSQAVGNGLLDYFYAPSRKSLRGKNANGVPIESILLSTEEASQWDRVNANFSAKNGYRLWGLDASASRTKARTLLGYYRGGFIKSSNLNDWGNDRRRLVVLNLVKNSPTHKYRQIVINQNSFSASDAPGVRAKINAIKPAAVKKRFIAD